MKGDLRELGGRAALPKYLLLYRYTAYLTLGLDSYARSIRIGSLDTYLPAYILYVRTYYKVGWSTRGKRILIKLRITISSAYTSRYGYLLADKWTRYEYTNWYVGN